MIRYFLLFLVLAFLPAQLASAQAVFYRDLQQGVSGEDVRQLQQFLNRDEDTQLNSFGLCSPGQETGFFNILTKIGVVKFQEKYASEILAPIGLKAGTGYVGALTRQKLNSLMNKTTSSAGNTFNNSLVSPTTTVATATVLGRPIITKIDPSEAENGATINIYGAGFTATDNTVITTFGSFEKIKSADGKKLTFKFNSEMLGSIADIDVDEDEIAKFDKSMQMARTAPLPIVVMVRNAGGLSEATTSFKVIIK